MASLDSTRWRLLPLDQVCPNIVKIINSFLSDGNDETDGSNDANASRNDDDATSRDEDGHDSTWLPRTTLLTLVSLSSNCPVYAQLICSSLIFLKFEF